MCLHILAQDMSKQFVLNVSQKGGVTANKMLRRSYSSLINSKQGNLMVHDTLCFV